MRRLERMQMGIALAGIFLCLTSATASFSGNQKTAAAATGQKTISSTVQLDFTKCTAVRIYGYPKNQDYTVYAHRQPEFKNIARAVNGARIASNGKGLPEIKLVFYNQQGDMLASIYETDMGFLFEPTHGLYFHAGTQLQETLQQVKREQPYREVMK